MVFEYKVIPAPNRGKRGKGRKGQEGRFSNALELTMNALAREGWEFVRAESLPAMEGGGFSRRKEVYHNVLVFRREADPTFLEEEPAKRRGFGLFRRAAKPELAAASVARTEPQFTEAEETPQTAPSELDEDHAEDLDLSADKEPDNDGADLQDQTEGALDPEDETDPEADAASSQEVSTKTEAQSETKPDKKPVPSAGKAKTTRKTATKKPASAKRAKAKSKKT